MSFDWEGWQAELQKPTMGNQRRLEPVDPLESFARLDPATQKRIVGQVRNGDIDRPERFSEMVEIVETYRRETAQLPGGTTHREKAEHEARVRAKMVDAPGQVERLHAQLRARNARRPMSSDEVPRKPPGYRSSYPWQ